MVKCALEFCHTNADVDRSFSADKTMLTKQNMFLSETIVGLRTIKTAVEECEGVNKGSSNTGLVKVANNLHRMYMEHLRQEKLKKRQTGAEKSKQEACKRKVDEIRPDKTV